MRHRAFTIVLVAVTMLASATVAYGATAATEGPSTAGPITHRQIFDKVSAGEELTAAEVAYVKATDLAALLPDPSHVEEVTTQTSSFDPAELPSRLSDGPPVEALLSGTTCSNTEKSWRQYSYLGAVLYRMHHSWRTCWNGSTVTAVWDRHTWFTETDSVFYDRGSTADWYSGVGTGLATSFTQHHIEYCVLVYGCYYSGYPWIRFYRYGSGHFSWSHGV